MFSPTRISPLSGDVGNPIQINGTVSGGTNTTILWTNSGTGSYNNATIENPIWTGTVAESITHTLTASSDNWIDIQDTVIVTTGVIFQPVWAKNINTLIGGL